MDNINDSLGGYKLTTINGKIGYYLESEGADSALPFNKNNYEITIIKDTEYNSQGTVLSNIDVGKYIISYEVKQLSTEYRHGYFYLDSVQIIDTGVGTVGFKVIDISQGMTLSYMTQKNAKFNYIVLIKIE